MSDHTDHLTKAMQLAKMAWELAKASAPPDLKTITIPEWDMLGEHHQKTFMAYLTIKGALNPLIEAVAFVSYHHETCTDHGTPKFN